MRKTLSTIVVSMLLATLPGSASAWWNWGPGEWVDQFFGGAGLSFDMSFSVGGSLGNRYYDYFNPYAMAPVAVPAPVTTLQQGSESQAGSASGSRPETERHTRDVARAVEAQRLLAREMSLQQKPSSEVKSDRGKALAVTEALVREAERPQTSGTGAPLSPASPWGTDGSSHHRGNAIPQKEEDRRETPFESRERRRQEAYKKYLERRARRDAEFGLLRNI